jgi:hypothetical protein
MLSRATLLHLTRSREYLVENYRRSISLDALAGEIGNWFSLSEPLGKH